MSVCSYTYNLSKLNSNREIRNLANTINESCVYLLEKKMCSVFIGFCIEAPQLHLDMRVYVFLSS